MSWTRLRSSASSSSAALARPASASRSAALQLTRVAEPCGAPPQRGCPGPHPVDVPLHGLDALAADRAGDLDAEARLIGGQGAEAGYGDRVGVAARAQGGLAGQVGEVTEGGRGVGHDPVAVRMCVIATNLFTPRPVLSS